MAFTSIMFENPNTGVIKKAPVGVSWTTLLFGPFPALLRGHWKWAILMLILAICSGGLSHFVFLFLYNKLYIQYLIGLGFKAKSIDNGKMDFAASKLGIKIPQLKPE